MFYFATFHFEYYSFFHQKCTYIYNQILSVSPLKKDLSSLKKDIVCRSHIQEKSLLLCLWAECVSKASCLCVLVWPHANAESYQDKTEKERKSCRKMGKVSVARILSFKTSVPGTHYREDCDKLIFYTQKNSLEFDYLFFPP